MLVRDLMQGDVIRVAADDCLRKAVDLMNEHHFRQLPVTGANGELVGIITDRDIRLHVVYMEDRLEDADHWNPGLEALVEGVMTRDPVTIHPDQSLRDAVDMFIQQKFGGVSVVDSEGNLLGILTYIDVLRALRDRV